MPNEQFRAALHQTPFRPFTIRIADGSAFEVRHPDFVAISFSGCTAIVYESDERYSILDLLLMSGLQVSS